MILQTGTSSELVFGPHSRHNNFLRITTKSKATDSYVIVNLHLNLTYETENL